MKIHEYQAKELLKTYGIPVPSGQIAKTPEEVYEYAKKYNKCVIKAQIHSGGRGKGGGVKLSNTPDEAKCIANQILGMNLVTKQTGPEGKTVHKVLVTEATDIEKEYYLSVAVDNENAGLVIIASAQGGTEIEEIAANRPDMIVKVPVSIYEGFRPYQGMELAKKLGLSGELKTELLEITKNMIRLFLEKDCSIVEINPLVLTAQGHLLAIDAKINFDDNALMRHNDIVALRDTDEEDPKEVEASDFDLNYIRLSGNIGCLVNGAGLAMATMDIIKKFGGEPANFLDVGGSATKERVTAAFDILLSDSNVKAIMVNIFGGIMKCDIIAEGIVAAAKTIDMTVPLIVRLEGTNVEKGKEILKTSGLSIISADDMADAARKAVMAAGGAM